MNNSFERTLNGGPRPGEAIAIEIVARDYPFVAPFSDKFRVPAGPVEPRKEIDLEESRGSVSIRSRDWLQRRSHSNFTYVVRPIRICSRIRFRGKFNARAR